MSSETLHRFLLADPGDRVPTQRAQFRFGVAQREAGPDFLTPWSDAFSTLDAYGRVLALLAPPAGEVAEPSAAYVRLLDGPDDAPRVALAAADPASRPDAPNAPSAALRTPVVMREGTAA